MYDLACSLLVINPPSSRTDSADASTPQTAISSQGSPRVIELRALRTLPIKLLLSQMDAIKAISPRNAAASGATLLWGVRQGSMAIGYTIGFLLIVP
jgi:hypothetical protein